MNLLSFSPFSPKDTTGLRLAGFYAALFAVVGVHMPYWPIWLAGKGLSPTEIGYLVAAGILIKVVANPLIGEVVDRRGKRRSTMVALAAATLICYILFAFADGFWPLLGLSLLAGGAFSAMIPLGENLSMLIAYAKKIEYGRVRLWGSVSFILSALIMGKILGWADTNVVLYGLWGGLALLLASG